MCVAMLLRACRRQLARRPLRWTAATFLSLPKTVIMRLPVGRQQRRNTVPQAGRLRPSAVTVGQSSCRPLGGLQGRESSRRLAQ